MPTRVGAGLRVRAPLPEQDEYDIPRDLLAPGPRTSTTPPVLGCCLASAARRWVARWWRGPGPSLPGCCAVQARPEALGQRLGSTSLPSGGPGPCITAPLLPQVYDTPPWKAAKGPRMGWTLAGCVRQPPVEKGLLPASHHAVSMEGLRAAQGAGCDCVRPAAGA